MPKKQVIAPERSLLHELSFLLMVIADYRCYLASAVVKTRQCPTGMSNSQERAPGRSLQLELNLLLVDIIVYRDYQIAVVVK